jgi:hypothetical protein
MESERFKRVPQLDTWRGASREVVTGAFHFKPQRADLPRESEIKRIYYLLIALPSAKGFSVRLERVAHRHVSRGT